MLRCPQCRLRGGLNPNRSFVELEASRIKGLEQDQIGDKLGTGTK